MRKKKRCARPHSPQAEGVLQYMLDHGSRILGLVRAGAYSLYGKARFPVSGSDQVYGLNVARRAWLTAKNVLNCQPLAAVRKFVKAKRDR